MLWSLPAIFIPGQAAATLHADGVACSYFDPKGQSKGFGFQAQATHAIPCSCTPEGGGREGIGADLLQCDLESTDPKRI